jgi:hypothetical protein
VAAKKPRTELVFDFANTATDCGLLNAKLFCRSSKAAAFSSSQQRAQMLQFD